MSRIDDTAKISHVLECALQAIPYGLLISDASLPGCPIVYCNPAGERMIGLKNGEILGRPWRSLEASETNLAGWGQVQQPMRDGQPCRVVLKDQHTDGSTFWYELSLTPERNAHGSLTHHICVLSDVTSRTAAEAKSAANHERLMIAYARERQIAESLQENQLQLADLLESIAEGFFALDGQWRFIYVNRQAEPLLGHTRQDLLGQEFWEMFSELRDGALHHDFRRAMAERVPVELTEFIAPRGAWWDVRAAPTPEGLTVFLRDVTEHQRAEDEKRQMQAQQRSFLRDVLASVTGGKLRLCYAVEELPPPFQPIGAPVLLSRTEGLSTLRHLADQAAGAAGFTEQQRCDLAISAGEAAMNAVVHAGTGTGTVSLGASGTVQVRIVDHGAGIAVENLPKATLERGFTTSGTMGYGMKIMLQALDRLWLLTSSAGTTVVLEKDSLPPEHDWLQSDPQGPTPAPDY